MGFRLGIDVYRRDAVDLGRRKYGDGPARALERVADRRSDDLPDELLFAEPDLGLGGMDVHVDAVRRQFDEQDRRRVRARRHHRTKAIHDRPAQQTVANVPAVYEQILRLARCSLLLRVRHVTADAHAVGLRLDLDKAVDERGAEQLVRALAKRPDRRHADGLAAIVHEAERDARVRKRVVRHEVGDVKALGRVALQELPSRGHVEEQVLDRDLGTAGPCDVAHGSEPSTVDRELRASDLRVRPCRERQFRDGRDRRQRLAAEPERRDRHQVLGGPQLAGRVALECKDRVVARHAFAVVRDAHEAAACACDLDLDAGGAGIERVLDELLCDGGGAFDDFARGDLVGEELRKDTDL